MTSKIRTTKVPVLGRNGGSKSKPFITETFKNQTFLESVLEGSSKSPDFKRFWILNGSISDLHCIFYEPTCFVVAAVVKRVVTNSGFRLMRKNSSEWCGTWGKHMKSHLFKDIHEAQKINHLPGFIRLNYR